MIPLTSNGYCASDRPAHLGSGHETQHCSRQKWPALGQTGHPNFLATTPGIYRIVFLVHGLGVCFIDGASFRRCLGTAHFACRHLGTHGGHRASSQRQVPHANGADGGFSCGTATLKGHVGFRRFVRDQFFSCHGTHHAGRRWQLCQSLFGQRTHHPGGGCVI